MSAWCGIAGTGHSCCLPLIPKNITVSSCGTVIKRCLLEHLPISSLWRTESGISNAGFSCRVDDRVRWEMLTSWGKFKVFCGHGLWISLLWITVAE